MTEDSNLTKAWDLKQQLEESEFRSLIDVILENVGVLLQKLAHRSKPPAPWVNALVIALLISLIGLLTLLLSGEVSQYGYRTLVIGGGLIFLVLVIPRSTIQRTFVTLRDELLDSVETSAGISSLCRWLTAVTSWKWPILCSLFYVVINLVYGAFFLEDMIMPMHIVVVGFAMFILLGMMIYYLLLFILLPGRLSRCHYRLNAFDPVSSEVVTHLSSLLNYIAYMIAFLLAAVALFAVSLVTFDVSNLIIAIPMWLVLIVIFVTNQISLSRIIRRAKRESLNQVEAHMAMLRRKKDLSDKETIEALMRTWDFHDRIKGTRNSVLDLRGIMNFINTLLIPLVAFLVANRNEILEIIGWRK
jgi:hypothetical protein